MEGTGEVEGEVERGRVGVGDAREGGALATEVRQVHHVLPPHHPHPYYPVPDLLAPHHLALLSLLSLYITGCKRGLH